MKRLLVVVVVVVLAVLAIGLALAGRQDTKGDHTLQPEIKSYSKDTPAGTTGSDNVGGSGTDTQPSPTGDDQDNSLLSQ